MTPQPLDQTFRLGIGPRRVEHRLQPIAQPRPTRGVLVGRQVVALAQPHGIVNQPPHQLRKRRRHELPELEAGDVAAQAEPRDPGSELDELWNAEWENNLLKAALDKARRRLDPRQYQIFDFSRNERQPVRKTTLPSWTACGVEMDPETGMVVINSSPSGWRSYTLLDLNTGKRKALSDSPWKFFVKKEVAQKWIELTK